MKYACIVFLFFVVTTSHAQNHDRFIIGQTRVGPEYDIATHTTWPVRGFMDEDPVERTNLEDSTRYHYLTPRQFSLVRELGIDLITVLVDENEVRRDSDPTNRNVVAEVCQAAIDNGDTLDVCIDDWGIANYMEAERLMFHPEATTDFDSLGGYEKIDDDDFNELPEPEMKLSTPISAQGVGDNAIVMEPGQGLISGLDPVRKTELSVFRILDKPTHAACGLYLVSVTVKDDPDLFAPDPPNTADTMMTVRIVTMDSTNINATDTLVFPLLGQAFYEADTLRADAFETVLGGIEVRQAVAPTGDTIICIRQRNPANDAWNDTTLFEIGKIKTTDSGFTQIDLCINYGTGNAKFFLDAVCLTNPGTYAFFYPDDTDSVSAHQFRRSQIENRLADLVLDESSPPDVYPNLRFIGAPEQSSTTGLWAATMLSARILDSISNSQVGLFAAAGKSWGATFAATMNTYINSGFYHYAVDSLAPRPTLSSTVPGLYHQQINQKDKRGLTETSRVFRRVAEERDRASSDYLWVPFVQNHSQLYDSLKSRSDGIPHREPTAAEIRQQCNLALAHGAEGILFYSFISDVGVTASPYWPKRLADWVQDTTGGSPRALDKRMGVLGFVQDTLGKRICDWNGENKWDSVKTYIQDFLRPVGDFIARNLTWEGSKEWNLQSVPQATGTNEYVSEVLSMRQDQPDPIDDPDSTFVVISEFSHGEIPYLLVMNGRSHPIEGHRHICVKLKGLAGTDGAEWRVTKILGETATGDIWIVRPSSNPDTTTIENGFTDYFEPGTAALYRLDEIENESTTFGGECLGGSVYIEPAATLRTGSTDQLYFSPGHGLFAEGWLISLGTEFGPCDLEEYWEGIYSKGSDSVYLDNVSVVNAGVVVGADGKAILTEASEISNTTSALYLTDGELHSSSTQSTDVMFHLWSYGDGLSNIDSDESNGSGQSGGAALYVTNGAECNVEESHFEDFYRGVYASDGSVYGDVDGSAPGSNGNNSFDCNRYGLSAVRGGNIEFGAISTSPGDFDAKNEIILPDSTYRQAIADANSVIYARQNWWEPVTQPPSVNYSGNVSYQNMLTSDPVPFTSHGGALFSKSTNTSSPPSPPSGIRAQISTASRMSSAGTLRHLIGQFVSSTSATTAEYTLLRYVYRHARESELSGCLDSLMTLCLARQDVESKLLVADMCSRDKRYYDALDILNSYSFIGSPELLTRAMVRKSILFPLARQGGYIDGLRVLDTLSQLVATDSSLLHFIHIYPRLYSGLSHSALLSLAPKESHTRIMDEVIPDGIELGQNYPNPFRDVTSFTFKLGEQTHVRLSVFDAMGREVAVVSDTEYGRGVHSAILQSAHLPSGLYFYRFMTKQGIIQKKMLLVR